MVKGLSTELARHAIYVNSVAPGWVDTDMSATALHNPKTSKAIFSVIPLGRAAKPEEIAAPILFLCTNHAGFITGEVFNVNGGAVLGGVKPQRRHLPAGLHPSPLLDNQRSAQSQLLVTFFLFA